AHDGRGTELDVGRGRAGRRAPRHPLREPTRRLGPELVGALRHDRRRRHLAPDRNDGHELRGRSVTPHRPGPRPNGHSGTSLGSSTKVADGRAQMIGASLLVLALIVGCSAAVGTSTPAPTDAPNAAARTGTAASLPATPMAPSTATAFSHPDTPTGTPTMEAIPSPSATPDLTSQPLRIAGSRVAVIQGADATLSSPVAV